MQSTLKKIIIPAQIGILNIRPRSSSSSSSQSASSESWSCDCVCPGDDCDYCPSDCTPDSFLVSIRNIVDCSGTPLYINCMTYCILQDSSSACRWILEDPDEYISLIELVISSSGATLTVKDTDDLLIFQDRVSLGEFNCGDIPTLFPNNAADCVRNDSSAECGFATIFPCCDCYQHLVFDREFIQEEEETYI